MMALLRVMWFLLLLIPLIAAARRFPQRRSAPISTTPNYVSEDNEAMELADYESGHSTTEFPYFDYTTRSNEEEEEESTEEETFEGILGETVTVPDVSDGPFEEAEKVDPPYDSLSELFYENHPVQEYDLGLCEARLRDGELWQHYTFLEHNVYLSSLDSNLAFGRVKPKAFTWQQAHDLCRSHCKEMFTLDSFDKAYLMSTIIKSDGLLGVWTSGRRCDFPGCRDRTDVKEDGWFWSTIGQEIHTSQEQTYLNKLPYRWSMTGRAGPQPDNAEFASRGVNESCLALRYEAGKKGGLKLHDMPCHYKLNVVCEEPRELNSLRDYL